MKRTEMIKVMVEILRYDLNERNSEKLYESTANHVLDELEKLGMLPPNMALVDGKFNQTKFNEIVSKGIGCNQWE